ncbi:unnamed protein product [Urochloa humidicola]
MMNWVGLPPSSPPTNPQIHPAPSNPNPTRIPPAPLLLAVPPPDRAPRSAQIHSDSTPPVGSRFRFAEDFSSFQQEKQNGSLG